MFSLQKFLTALGTSQGGWKAESQVREPQHMNSVNWKWKELNHYISVPGNKHLEFAWPFRLRLFGASASEFLTFFHQFWLRRGQEKETVLTAEWPVFLPVFFTVELSDLETVTNSPWHPHFRLGSGYRCHTWLVEMLENQWEEESKAQHRHCHRAITWYVWDGGSNCFYRWYENGVIN